MTMPTMADVFKFIFRHDEWQKEQEAQMFVEMVDYLAQRHDIKSIPAIEQIKQLAPVIVRNGRQRFYYSELDTNLLISVSDGGMTVSIHEAWFGRTIPLNELFDWVMRYRGHATKVIVNAGGMKVTTNHGGIIEVPGCEIYLGRLAEDGLRYRNACFMIAHITGGSIMLKPADLINKTQNITVELTNGEWTVNTGIPAKSS